MSVEKLNPEGLHEPVDNLYSHVVRYTGGLNVTIGGQVALDVQGNNVFVDDMAGQIRFCYEQVSLALAAVRLTWENVVHIYTFTTAMDEYMRYERSIAKEFFGEDPPASTLVEVSRLVDPEWLVEVQVEAVADE